jgi:hypothetical protein
MQTDRTYKNQFTRSLDEALQTEQSLFIPYIADLFYGELKLNLTEELEKQEAIQLRMLLDKSKSIIERIK